MLWNALAASEIEKRGKARQTCEGVSAEPLDRRRDWAVRWARCDSARLGTKPSFEYFRRAALAPLCCLRRLIRQKGYSKEHSASTYRHDRGGEALHTEPSRPSYFKPPHAGAHIQWSALV